MVGVVMPGFEKSATAPPDAIAVTMLSVTNITVKTLHNQSNALFAPLDAILSLAYRLVSIDINVA